MCVQVGSERETGTREHRSGNGLQTAECAGGRDCKWLRLQVGVAEEWGGSV